MKNKKKILSFLIKVLIGIGSFAVIYYRLRHELTPEKVGLLGSTVVTIKSALSILLCLLFMPVNWGIEAYKWRLITRPVEDIGYGRASRSVYSGVCLGNFAPGRATEFIAKILYFSEDKRPQVTVLHFINGMFQFSVTVIVGFTALLIKLNDFGGDYYWLIYITGTIGLVMLIVLAFCIYKIDGLLHFITKKISRRNEISEFNYAFSLRTVATLFSFSLLRYLVFFSQFGLLIYIFQSQGNSLELLSGIAIYFLITATIPMFSVVEAAIRAAVALLVFKDSGLSDSVIALCTVLIWLINIIMPSLIGYYFLIRENFNFKFIKSSQ